jgi:hypothetical protein
MTELALFVFLAFVVAPLALVFLGARRARRDDHLVREERGRGYPSTPRRASPQQLADLEECRAIAALPEGEEPSRG